MAEPTLDGFLSKQEIYDRFGRHRRTLTKDIRNAFAQDDTELLSLVRVQTQDGKVREGTELSAGSLKELTAERLNPTIYLHPDFVEKVIQRKRQASPRIKPETAQGTPKQPNQSATVPKSPSGPDDGPPLPDDPDARRIVLEHLHFHERRHREEASELMDRILQVVETNQKLQGQTNQLMNQFQDVLKEGGGLTNMIAPARRHGSTPQPTVGEEPQQPSTTSASVVDATVRAKPTPKRKTSPAKRKPTPKKSSQRKRTPKKPATRKKTPAKKKSIWKRDFREFLRL